MRAACLISRGHTASYSTNGGGVDVRSKAEPRPAPEAVATDLKACNDRSGLGYIGLLQFARCMAPRGYVVSSGAVNSEKFPRKNLPTHVVRSHLSG